MQLRPLLVSISAVLLAANVIFIASVIWPKWAFSHSGGTERVRIHATEPVPPEAAAWADAMISALDESLLPPGGEPVDVFITGSGWRYDWFFLPVRGAGGAVYAILPNRNIFLSGADFAADRLLRDGRIVAPPRTLSYYARHEIAHLIQLGRLGPLGYLRLDYFVREGIADYIALGPASPDLQRAITASYPDGADAALREEHGSYPTGRVAVTLALETETIEQLMGVSR